MPIDTTLRCLVTGANRGLGQEFERAKRFVVERDGGHCQLRRPGCTHLATTADRIVPRSRGGTTELSNLRASCGHCNSGTRAASR